MFGKNKCLLRWMAVHLYIWDGSEWKMSGPATCVKFCTWYSESQRSGRCCVREGLLETYFDPGGENRSPGSCGGPTTDYGHGARAGIILEILYFQGLQEAMNLYKFTQDANFLLPLCQDQYSGTKLGGMPSIFEKFVRFVAKVGCHGLVARGVW